MEDQPNQEHHDNSSAPPISGSSLLPLAQRALVRALEKSGDERLQRIVRIVKEAPELLGDKLGPILGILFKKIAGGGKLSPEDHKTLETALESSPADVKLVVDLAEASLLDGVVPAAEERRAILQSYKFAFDIVCSYMAKGTTSVVLRGFIHSDSCLSYWHFERSNLTMSASTDYLYPNGLEIYLLEENPAETNGERFVGLNRAIRNNPHRQLLGKDYDFEKDDTVAKVTKINETDIEFAQLAKDRASQPPPTEGPFGGVVGTDYNSPIDYVAGIPEGLDELAVMIDSLHDAKSILSLRKESSENAQQRIKESAKG